MTEKPKKEYTMRYERLSGGLNYSVAEHQLGASETCEMRNLLWRNGMLASRKGQAWLNSSKSGTGHGAYDRLWHGHLFCHIGSAIFAVHAETGAESLLCDGVPEIRGTFFVYEDKLYYKTRGAYKAIRAAENGGRWSFTASDVEAYVPILVINASPSNGSGDLYQPENRLSSRKTIWYNAQNGITTYYLPVVATRIIEITVDGVKLGTNAYAYNYSTGMIKFNTAPPVTNPPTNNTVRITYELANPDAKTSIDECRYAEVYGGTGSLCIVFAGSNIQPNAYYWNGQNSVHMDPGYFPIEQVQLAGDYHDRITGFGKVQNALILFLEHSIGKTVLGTVEINDRLSIDLPYAPINARIGCAYPWSIQLIENHLVWANREGVYTMLDTTPADENAILCISRKINGNEWRRGLQFDLTEENEDCVCSVDDDKHYCIAASGRGWVWDYEISSETTPSWFLLTNLAAAALIREDRQLWHLNAEGQITRLTEEFSDYGQPIDRVYRFAPLSFGGYDCRKNINSVILTLGAFVPTDTELCYLTDHELRRDLTNLIVVPSADYERNRDVGTRAESDMVPAVFRRKPHCLRVIQFAMRLRNANINEDVAIVGAEVFYTKQGRLR